MFIPNKTLHLIKTGAIILLCALVSVIAVQAVLYIKMSADNKTQMKTMQANLDSLKVSSEKFETTSLGKHLMSEKDIILAQENLDSLNAQVSSLQESVNKLLFNTDILINNECQVRPYYMDKRLLEMCK
jgi:predicted RND superfamily exporter protein